MTGTTPIDTIIQGDALARLKEMSSESVDCCITSPPYFGLRSYLPDGHQDKHMEIGLDATPEAYVSKLVAVFREVRRVLKKEGTLWLNLGDSYSGNGKALPLGSPNLSRHGGKGCNPKNENALYGRAPTPDNCKPKDLIGIPWAVAFALRADGWYLRSDIIWHKPNCMPESCRDRPTKSHEYIFLLSKSQKYYYDGEAIKEPTTGNAHSRGNGLHPKIANPGEGIKENTSFEAFKREPIPHRNKRSVWSIPSHPFAEAHFATFPEKLIEPCILAGCPEGGICLDPFFGAGTTGLVAKKLGRCFIGIELNEAYIDMAQKRVAAVPARLDRWAEAVV